MSSGRPLVICLLTYNRLDYAKTTLESTLENINHKGNIHLHIADDGSPEGYIEELESFAFDNGPLVSITRSNSEHRGYGANYNLAMQQVHSCAGPGAIVLPLEDDWQLVRELDTAPLVQALEAGYGCARLGYLGYTQTLMGTVVHVGDYNYLELNPYSDEPHVFAGHPRLETIAWERAVGPWPEGLQPGETEMDVTHIPAARKGVLWPMDLVSATSPYFVHIGTVRSY